MDLNGKIVWITGAGRGIGRATVQLFATKGARVVASARTEQELEHVVTKINANGDSALAVPCDASRNDEVLALVNDVAKTWGDIDILINNAGIGIFKKIIDLQEKDWDQMMQINLKSAFLCSRAVLPAMIARQSGCIINVVSVAGRQPFRNSGGYCASKYGLLGFTDVLRLENRQHGIKVSAVLPGATSTTIWGDADVDHNAMMSADDVAAVIVSICETDEAAMIEEVVLRPQGGDL